MKQVSDSPSLTVGKEFQHSVKVKSAAEMPAPGSTDWIKLAAFLDGEGCFGVFPNNRSRDGNDNPTYASVVSIAQNDPRLTEWLYETFGGAVYINGSKKRYRPMFQWTLPTASQPFVLAQVRPHLLLKGEQGDLLAEFLTLVPKKGARATELYEAIRSEKHKWRLPANQ